MRLFILLFAFVFLIQNSQQSMASQQSSDFVSINRVSEFDKVKSNVSLFAKCIRKIKKIAFEKNINKEQVLKQVLEIHDELLNFYSTETNDEEDMIKIIVELLDKSIRIRKLL
jgi:hypothetical protein